MFFWCQVGCLETFKTLGKISIIPIATTEIETGRIKAEGRTSSILFTYNKKIKNKAKANVWIGYWNKETIEEIWTNNVKFLPILLGKFKTLFYWLVVWLKL